MSGNVKQMPNVELDIFLHRFIHCVRGRSDTTCKF